MESKAPSTPYADVTGTSDIPSVEADLYIAPPCGTTTRDWADRVGRAAARHPEYLLAGAAVVGFLAGRTVKRLLSSNGGRS